MSKQLPIEIRRHYSVTNNKDHWVLKCDTCAAKYQLKKPAKGKDIHGGNLLALLDHAASHPLPEEEKEEVASTANNLSRLSEPFRPSLPAPEPVKAEVFQKDTVKYQNAYKIDWHGSPDLCHMVKVSRFVDPTFEMFRHVQRLSEYHYSVVVQAANTKHGRLVGERLIHKFFREQSNADRG